MAQPSKRKKRALRSPFLITVAALAGAVAPACGGNVGGDGSSGAGGSTGTGGSATGGGAVTGGSGGGANPACPAEEPGSGTSCASEGQTCSYPFCGTSNGTAYTCRSGSWERTLTTSCNPPPPWQEVCPDDKPAEGAGCYVNPVLKCSYIASYCCGSPNGTVDFYCQGYAWHSVGGSIGTCNPPAPTCPTAVPTEGQACCFVGPAAGCNYGCGYYLGATYRATCDGSQWHVTAGGSCNPPPPCWDAGWGCVPIEDGGPPLLVDAAPE